MTLQAGQRVTGPSSPPAVRAGDAGEGASGRDLVADGQRPVPVLRWFGLVWLTAFVVLLANQPGRMVFDTKLAVDLDPAGYFASLWHLWDPLDSFGTLHNQAVGYAVPMAPVYLAGQLAHVPVWITERLWMSLIIAAGFSGLVKLADALGIGSRNSRVLAGLVFALWPTFTIVIGSTSAAVLPGMLAPWAVLPLVKAVHPGRPGWSGPLWPAARSGAVVLLMGGVNATSTLYVLLLPGLFIVTYARGRRLVSLFLAWGAAVAAATAWWTLPLLLQGKYAFNFLPYVEQSATTTATTSAAATLRGAGNWVAYLNFGTPWLPAGWAMVTTPIAIIAAAAAAGCGLYGLSRRRMPAATWLRLSAGIAAAIALAGYSGPLGGPFHGAVQHVLDGTLAPFRNVYKVEPVIAAALALGVAHATARWLAATPGDSQPDRKALAIVSRLVLGFMLVGLAVPYLSGRILNPGSFPAVPRYWSQAAGFLAAHSPRNAALVVPADAHGEYLWGDPIDDPLGALGTSPWVAQGLVPYGGAGSQLVLQTAENAIESGEQVPGLGAYLERAGIRYVVVRNDLDGLQVGYTPPAVVHQTLALSGFTRVASFGAVEIYAVPGSGQPLSPVSTLPVSQTVLVNGGPDSLLQLAGQNLLGPGQPAIVAGNPLPGSAPGWPARWAVTDGLRRADEAFGLINSNISYTYTATENNPVDDQLGGAGGPPRQFLPVPAAGHQTVAVLSGAAQVSVSSYGSWLADTQQEDPASAFDGNAATAWTEGSATTPAGQWIQVIFDHPVELPASVGIRLLDDNPDREIASRLRVSTAAGSTTSRVTATGKTQPLCVAPGRTSWLRITIAGAERVTPGGPGAGISDVLIPGVRVTRLLQPAEDPAGQRAASVSFSFQQQVPSPVTFADPAGTAPMARAFTLPQPAALRLSATALAVPGAGLDALLDKIPPPGRGFLQVGVATASPWSGPASLIRGSGPQPLITDSANPVIHLSWHGKRRIRSLIVQPAGGSVPQTVEIRSPAGTRQAGVGFGGLVVFKQPLTTDRLDVSFPRVQQAITVSSTGQRSTLPVELSRLSVPALAKLRPVAPRARLSLACGQGPALRIDGRAYRTAVSGTLGELSGYRPLQVRLCAPDGTLALGAGRHTLTAAPGTFAVTDLSLTGAGPSGPAGAAAPGASRTVTAARWQPDQRRLTIGPGPASYLEVHENYNAGWAATLNGHALRAVYLDGWQQGFVVPAGAGGTITLTFRPAASYHLALVVSLLALAVLLGLVAWSFVFRYGRAVRYAGVPAGTVLPRHAAWWLGSLGVIALTFIAGGPVVLAAVVVAGLAWWWPRWLPVLAFSGMAVAGLLTATAAQPAAAGLFGAFGAPAQACALVALAAALVPARDRQRQEQPGAFGVVDELTCYFDSPAEPGNVHMEVWLPGHLDPERLREATTAMLAGQPRARARRAPGSAWQSGYTWEFPPQADLDPVSVTSWQAEAELDSARIRFLAAAPPLDRSPPFRLLLARGPAQDSLILNAHHAAFDGHSCLRLLRLIAGQYSAGQYSAGQYSAGQYRQVEPGLAAGAEVLPAPAEPSGPPAVAAVAAEQGRVRPPVRRTARIAPQHEKTQREKTQHENGRRPDRAPGYGYRLLLWPDVPGVPAAGEGEPRATVNDLLIAALIETVRRWNRGRRQRDNAESCIRISVPLDARPPGGGDELGNLSRLGTVTAEPDGPAGRELVALVAGQTRQAKDQPGPQVDPSLAAVARARLPVAVKRRLLRAAVRCLGPLASDTSLITNLGRVTDPPRFGPLSPVRMWFSTSAHMPRGLSVGAITIEGRLQLCFRYRRALLDDVAAGDFAATYAAALSSLTEPPEKEQGT